MAEEVQFEESLVLGDLYYYKVACCLLLQLDWDDLGQVLVNSDLLELEEAPVRYLNLATLATKLRHTWRGREHVSSLVRRRSGVIGGEQIPGLL